ncbi:hypothetical protein CPB86DRAFT_859915, partial [Serendipita vermifera]
TNGEEAGDEDSLSEKEPKEKTMKQALEGFLTGAVEGGNGTSSGDGMMSAVDAGIMEQSDRIVEKMKQIQQRFETLLAAEDAAAAIEPEVDENMEPVDVNKPADQRMKKRKILRKMTPQPQLLAISAELIVEVFMQAPKLGSIRLRTLKTNNLTFWLKKSRAAPSMMNIHLILAWSCLISKRLPVVLVSLLSELLLPPLPEFHPESCGSITTDNDNDNFQSMYSTSPRMNGGSSLLKPVPSWQNGRKPDIHNARLYEDILALVLLSKLFEHGD